MIFNKCSTIFKNLTHIHKACRNMSSFTEQKILVGQQTINYVKVGSGDKPVLFLPGALGSVWTDFRPQIEKLPALLPPNSSLIAWDPPGYGQSSPPHRSFTTDFFKNDAVAAKELMKTLGFNTQYSLVGWSDGGITAMVLAAAFPEQIDKLIVWGSNSYVLPEEMAIYESKEIV